VFTFKATVSAALLAIAAKVGPERRSTRSFAVPPALPAFNRQRTTCPSIGEAATGVPAEVWMYVHEIVATHTVVFAGPARLLPVVTSAEAPAAGSKAIAIDAAIAAVALLQLRAASP